MALYKKEVTEAIGMREISLKSRKIYSGGEEIVTRLLSDIWDGVDKVSTTWAESKIIEKKG